MTVLSDCTVVSPAWNEHNAMADVERAPCNGHRGKTTVKQNESLSM